MKLGKDGACPPGDTCGPRRLPPPGSKVTLSRSPLSWPHRGPAPPAWQATPDTFSWTLQLSPRPGNLLGTVWLAGHWLTPSLPTVGGEGRH